MGAQGPTGPAGPKDSIIENTLGIYAFACMEMDRPYFGCITRAGESPSEKFSAAVIPETHVAFESMGGDFVLHLAVRRGFEGWCNPPKTAREMARANAFWSQAV
jgi:hypothetical protein